MQAQRTRAGFRSQDFSGGAVVMAFPVDAERLSDWLEDRDDAIGVLMHGQQRLGLTAAECRRLASSAAPMGWMA